MSTEQRYRMEIRCDCLSCSVAAAINKHYPEGVSEENAVEIVAKLMTTGAAIVRRVIGEGEMIAPPMPLGLADTLMSEWSPPQ